MKEVMKEIKVYMVGNKEFLDKQEAQEYEGELMKALKRVYFTVSHSPDLTEGRCYYGQTVVAAPKGYVEYETVLQYCIDNFGSPLEFVMGISPVANYKISKGEQFETIEELGEFKEKNKAIIYLNERGKEIEIEN